VQLHEKGGKQHAMPCHHALAKALLAYIDAAGIAEDRTGYLFRTSPGHTATVLTLAAEGTHFETPNNFASSVIHRSAY
jgi:hypothetical protein